MWNHPLMLAVVYLTLTLSIAWFFSISLLDFL